MSCANHLRGTYVFSQTLSLKFQLKTLTTLIIIFLSPISRLLSLKSIPYSPKSKSFPNHKHSPTYRYYSDVLKDSSAGAAIPPPTSSFSLLRLSLSLQLLNIGVCVCRMARRVKGVLMCEIGSVGVCECKTPLIGRSWPENFVGGRSAERGAGKFF
ncbi:hypothetical protein HanIR_Chr01g0030961 [Helianthus annuus]|nr:hypothetical protein HanIR_Chr01g0030961 [Helianthus annuus]